VNDAIVKFALKNLPKLQILCFRGKLNDNLVKLLKTFGYEEDQKMEFPLILRGSSKSSLLTK
jgi:hypothetical protein